MSARSPLLPQTWKGKGGWLLLQRTGIRQVGVGREEDAFVYTFFLLSNCVYYLQESVI